MGAAAGYGSRGKDRHSLGSGEICYVIEWNTCLQLKPGAPCAS